MKLNLYALDKERVGLKVKENMNRVEFGFMSVVLPQVHGRP